MKSLIVANPVSGSFSKEKFDDCLSILNKKLTNIEVVFTKYRGHARDVAEFENYDFIIAAGGDGLINEIVNGIEKKSENESSTFLFYTLPFGTSNVFCREYNIPINPLDAASKMKITEFEPIPLGIIGDKIFTLMVGFGYDCLAVKNVNLKLKKKFGKFAYIKSGFDTFLGENFEKFEIFFNRKKRSVYHLIVAVSNCYAGSFKLSKNFSKNNLNIFYEEKSGKNVILKNVLSIALGFGFKGEHELTEILKISGVKECQIDGDYEQLNSITNYVKFRKSQFYLVKANI